MQVELIHKAGHIHNVIVVYTTILAYEAFYGPSAWLDSSSAAFYA